jgi:mRNA-degrading endonuclease RelE of RelBE toxin-antitoxin system
MSWTVELTTKAEKQLKDVPSKLRRPVQRAIQAMETDPFSGNVKALQGQEWGGVYRKRAGKYRIIFELLHRDRIARVVAILLRSERTYRQ